MIHSIMVALQTLKWISVLDFLRTSCPPLASISLPSNERSATARAKMPQKHGRAPIKDKSFTPGLSQAFSPFEISHVPF